MAKVFQYVLQAFYYALFMGLVWYFSIKPPYHQLEHDQAVITLSFTHATEVAEPCRKKTQEELMKLPPNMRLAMDCKRERSPLNLELYLDEHKLTKVTLQPTGLHKDQGVNMFQSIKVKAGTHNLRIFMNDDVKVEGPTYKYEKKVSIKPEQLLLIDFDAGAGGFFLN